MTFAVVHVSSPGCLVDRTLHPVLEGDVQWIRDRLRMEVESWEVTVLPQRFADWNSAFKFALDIAERMHFQVCMYDYSQGEH